MSAQRVEKNQHLGDILEQQANKNPNAHALWWKDSFISYQCLYNQAQQLAANIATTTATGDRIAVLAWNSPAYIALLYAVPLASRVLVPLNARHSATELGKQLQLTTPTLVFVDDVLADTLIQSLEQCSDAEQATYPTVIRFGSETDSAGNQANDHAHRTVPFDHWLQRSSDSPLPTVSSDALAWLLFTSGTTGQAKAAELTHRHLLAGLASGAQGRPVKQDDRYLYPFPLFHIAAHNVLLQHSHGACVVLPPGFDAGRVIECCAALSVTTLSLAPTMITMLLDHPSFDPAQFASVRTIGYGASAISPSLLQRVMQITDAGLCQGYGMTELAGSVAFLNADDHRNALTVMPERLHAAGRIVAGVDICLLDENYRRVDEVGTSGEIAVRGPQVIDRYWRNDRANQAAFVDGWFLTGDIGRFDRDGYLSIIDRKKEIIVSGGENVSAREVEHALLEHERISDAAVVGIADARWGERVCAVVVTAAATDRHNNRTSLDTLGETVSDALLAAHCRRLLANYKIPKRYYASPQLPRNAAGKIDKHALRSAIVSGTLRPLATPLVSIQRVENNRTEPPDHWTIHSGEYWYLTGTGCGQLFDTLSAAPVHGAHTERMAVVTQWHSSLYNSGEQRRVARVSHTEQAYLLERERQRDDSAFTDQVFQGTPLRALLDEVDELSEKGAERQYRYCEAFGLVHRLDTGLTALSSGEARKCLLLRALLSDAEIILLDDPFANLDPASRQTAVRLLQETNSHRAIIHTERGQSELPRGTTHVAEFTIGGNIKRYTTDRFQQLAARPNQNETKVDVVTLPPPPSSLGTAGSDKKTAHIPAGYPVVTMQGVCIAYGGTTVIDKLDWRIRAGQHWQVHGPNGSGKTTLLNLISGDHPQCYSNQIEVMGYRRGSGESIWDIKRHIGMVSSELHWSYRVPSTARAIIISGLHDTIGLYQSPSASEIALAGEWLAVLGLTQRADTPFNQLTIAEQRMVLIARAMIKHPALLLLDEPCVALDRGDRRRLLALIEKLIDGGSTTLIYVTHHREDRIAAIEAHLEMPEGRQRITAV